MSKIQNIRANDPWCGPDFRWKEATRLHEKGMKPPRWEDPLVRTLWRALKTKALAPESSNRPSQSIVVNAVRLRSNGPVRDELEARLLTGAGIEKVAQLMNLPVPLVSLYHDLFFDVTRKLTASDWIFLHIIQTWVTPDEGQIWRLAAWQCPFLLDLLINDSRGCTDPAEHRLAVRLRMMISILNTPFSHPSFTYTCHALARETQDRASQSSDPLLSKIMASLEAGVRIAQMIAREAQMEAASNKSKTRQNPPPVASPQTAPAVTSRLRETPPLDGHTRISSN